MSNVSRSLSFPLDDDGFFRRACPFCMREFKILVRQDELAELAEKGLHSFLLETQGESPEPEEESNEDVFTCPYCGQPAVEDNWWTREQGAYINVVVENVIAEMMNTQLIDPLEKSFPTGGTSLISISVEGGRMSLREPWISPETNDMEVFDLPCCGRKEKVEEAWAKKVYCFFCGFPHLPHHGSEDS